MSSIKILFKERELVPPQAGPYRHLRLGFINYNKEAFKSLDIKRELLPAYLFY